MFSRWPGIRRGWWWMAVAASVFACVACRAPAGPSRPPQEEKAGAAEPAEPWPATAVTLYLPGTTALLYRKTVEFRVPPAELPRAVMEELIRSVLPPRTRLLDIGLHDGTCAVNLSAEFAAGADPSVHEWEREARLVYSVVNSLGSLPGVRRVLIQVEGERVEGIGAKLIDLSGPLEPFPGISLDWLRRERDRQQARRQGMEELPPGRVIDLDKLPVVCSYQLKGWGHPQVMFADLTGDGRAEMVIAGSRSVQVHGLDLAERPPLWEYSCGPLPEGSRLVALLADVDENNVPELVVFPTCDPGFLLEEPEPPDTELLVVAGDGQGVRVVWRAELGDNPPTGLVHGDFRGEGRDALALRRVKGTADLRFAGGSYHLVEGSIGFPSRVLAIADLDGVPPPELVAHSNWESNPGCSPEYIDVLRWDGSKWVWVEHFARIRPLVALWVARDDSPGYLALASVLNPGLTLHRWDRQGPAEPREIDVTSAEGKHLIVWDLAFVCSSRHDAPRLVVTGSLPDQSHVGFLVVLDTEGRRLFSSVILDRYARILPMDLDGDGQAELVVGNDIFRCREGEWSRYVLKGKLPPDSSASRSIVAARPGEGGEVELFVSVSWHEEEGYRCEISRVRVSLPDGESSPGGG